MTYILIKKLMKRYLKILKRGGLINEKIIIYFITYIIFIPSVNAELLYESQDITLLNRLLLEFPFETWFAPGESANYNNTNYIQIDGSTVKSLDTLPKYFYTISCNTGGLDLNTTSVTKGDIVYQGSVWGSSGCNIGSYSGQYVLNKWLIKQWNYYEVVPMFMFMVSNGL